MKSHQLDDKKPKSKGKGRKKIAYKKILDRNKRNITFAKRVKGALKKLAELSRLCGAKVAVYIENPSNDAVYTGASQNIRMGRCLQMFITNFGKLNEQPRDATQVDERTT